MCNSSIDFQNFFPSKQLEIAKILEDTGIIKINLKSQTNACICPKCDTFSNDHHGTYVRKVQGLPILGKRVLLEINAYEYKCENKDCSNKTISKSFDDFISYYSRMTERLSDFLCTLTLETSCEGASRIAKTMNIKVSGDTIIKISLKNMMLLNQSLVAVQ